MNKKGQAGTTVIVELIIAAFIIGLLIAVIAITNASMITTSGYETSGSIAKMSEATTIIVNASKYTNFTSAQADKNSQCTVLAVSNKSGAGSGKPINSGNYTVTNCAIKQVGTNVAYKNYLWLINYTYTKQQISAAGQAINATTVSLKDVPSNNFSLWVTVGGLVVVVSLIAIVIVTLRGAGFGMGGGGA